MLKVPFYKLHVLFIQTAVLIAFFAVYIYVIYPVYKYSGFNFDFSLDILALSLILFFILMLIGLFIRNEFIYASWQILFLFLFPGTSVYHVFNEVTILPLLYVSLFYFIIAFSDIISFRIKGFTLNIENNDNNLFVFLAIILIMVLPFLQYLPYINLKNLLFMEIYETRLAFREIQTNITGYLFSPLTRVALPTLIIIAIFRKKWWMLLLSVFLLMYLFLCGAPKGIFIGMFAVLLFYYGSYKFKPVLFGYLILYIVAIGLIVFFVGQKYLGLDQVDSATIIGVFIRRVFFLPPLLDAVYYEHFAENYLYYSQSFPVNLFVEYPLDKDLTMYVGQDVLNYPHMSANVGVVTESYISIGFKGVLLISSIFLVIFSFLKGLNIPARYFGIIFIYLFQMNSSFFTVLLATHGLLFMLIFFRFFIKDKDINLLK